MPPPLLFQERRHPLISQVQNGGPPLKSSLTPLVINYEHSHMTNGPWSLLFPVPAWVHYITT